MSLLKRLRTKKAIQTVLSDDGMSRAAKAQAIATLKQLGKAAVPHLIQAPAQGTVSPPLIDLLATLIDNSTLPLCSQALGSNNPAIVRGVVQALVQGKKFDPNQLFVWFTDPKIPKTELVTILTAHKPALHLKTLLELLETADKTAQSAVLRLVDQVADAAIVPDLIPYTAHREWLVRLHVTRILSRFSSEAVRDTLLRLLTDTHKEIRQAALQGLAGLPIPFDVGQVCQLLRDPDLTVQSKAIETLIQINNPQAVHHLLDVLQDESEYVRRAAVEVLNAIGNTNAIKDLLGALRDQDWWVRVRAADALGNIGGQRVLEAVVPLMRDEDTFIRRCAIEILNTKHDPQTVEVLLEALEDPDWWVRERAIDALLPLGDVRAFPALARLAARETETTPAAIRALVSLRDERGIDILLPKLRSPDKAVLKEALHGLQTLTIAPYVEVVQEALHQLIDDAEGEIAELATRTLQHLIAGYGERSAPVTMGVSRTPAVGLEEGATGAATTLLTRLPPAERESTPAGPVLPPVTSPASASLQEIDPTALEVDTILVNRYRVIRQIGKGAFGIVVLVEDMVVHEEIILKFLNPYLAANESVIKRFIHELRYARKITHENVIRIYDFLTLGKSCAISMEYFPSHTLAVEMASMGAERRPRRFEMLRDICKGMSVAHQANIVHRDLKPQNILINDHGLVKIVDFGLAAAISHPDSRLTGSGTLMGTPTYMAPEQIRGAEVDPRTDIYSLGVIMYEMFTGRPPYVGADPLSVLYQHIEGQAPRPRERNPAIPEAVEAIICRAMAVHPEQRYQTVDALRAHLESLSAAEQA